ncbi:MAG TPA: hypothetical protein VF177_19770, partial [Anaerolineae bacterium]
SLQTRKVRSIGFSRSVSTKAVTTNGGYQRYMYEYRKLTPKERQKLVEERLSRGYPPHRPPHLALDQTYYLLTAACYEHRHHLHSAERRQHILDRLFEQFILHGMVVLA